MTDNCRNSLGTHEVTLMHGANLFYFNLLAIFLMCLVPLSRRSPGIEAQSSVLLIRGSWLGAETPLGQGCLYQVTISALFAVSTKSRWRPMNA